MNPDGAQPPMPPATGAHGGGPRTVPAPRPRPGAAGAVPPRTTPDGTRDAERHTW
ncbi:hypothetical protein AB0G74_23155 [Streptomyces sp. NPDC020875]|uniref:hypothetical protein n=1 Tax=Streptomyces sp. NPDC020875 TaxID=3154898 RepID=UPI0033FAB6DB